MPDRRPFDHIGTVEARDVNADGVVDEAKAGSLTYQRPGYLSPITIALGVGALALAAWGVFGRRR